MNIHSLSSNFENLFQGLQPKAIILYLGGNDLTLGLSAIEIVNQIRIFIQMIHQKFPSTTIFNVSIKPSFERQELLEVIQQINQGMLELSMQFYYLHQVKLYLMKIKLILMIRKKMIFLDQKKLVLFINKTIFFLTLLL